MRISVEQDTEALQMQLLKICDYEKPHRVFFRNGSSYLLTPEQASRILNNGYNKPPNRRVSTYRIASLDADVFECVFSKELENTVYAD